MLIAVSIWNLEIGFIGSGEEMPRAHGIIEAMRRRGIPVHGEPPWWNVSYRDLETRADALSILSGELDGIDPDWRDVLTAA